MLSLKMDFKIVLLAWKKHDALFQLPQTTNRVTLLLILIFLGLQSLLTANASTWNDISRLNLEVVNDIVQVHTESDVVDTLKSLSSGEHIVISGTRHSQGGHITYPGAIVLDMTNFNKVISIFPKRKSIIVQSGATWSQVQKAVNKYGLSVRVMQSSNIFSIGGSLSANVHGRDPRYGPIIETIKSLKIVLHNGETVVSSRDTLPDLFYATIGGYGLLGVILEAEIELTDNLPLEKITKEVKAQDYTSLFESEVETMSLHYGRCSFVKGKSFLRECYSTSFYETALNSLVSKLEPEKNIKRNALIFNASRKNEFGKVVRWNLQKELIDIPDKLISTERNQAMQPPVRFLSYNSPEDTDILQEYFVPSENFDGFFERLRDQLLLSEVNLLSVTLRYLKENQESLLSYSTNNMIAVVLYINIGLDKQSISAAGVWTKRLVDLALQHGGTYYLTYQRFPTVEQFQSAYPRWEEFMKVKCKYDPQEVFVSKFYEEYLKAAYKKCSKNL